VTKKYTKSQGEQTSLDMIPRYQRKECCCSSNYPYWLWYFTSKYSSIIFTKGCKLNWSKPNFLGLMEPKAQDVDVIVE
jgi:hypothetical protein